MKIVLASKSPRRKEILSMVVPELEIRVSDAEETFDNEMSPFDIPRALAIKKAQSVAVNEEEIVIGCDTLVISQNFEIMGKPKNDNEAVRMLKKLSGTTHYVVSGICVRAKEKELSEAVTTRVTMRALEEREILAYVGKDHPTDKAGAYGIQDMAGAFVSGIEGDFYNVVGLPLCRLCEILKKEFDFNLIK